MQKVEEAFDDLYEKLQQPDFQYPTSYYTEKKSLIWQSSLTNLIDQIASHAAKCNS